MKLRKIVATNYRNLPADGLTFHPLQNFIVGENNIGKSNILDFLDIILNKRRFLINDFRDASAPIEGELTISLSDLELGHFDDYFSPQIDNEINIIARQEDPTEFVRFFHKESQSEIPSKKLRALNFIKYDSLRIPKDEINFGKTKGVGKFLNNLISNYIEQKSLDDINKIINTAIISDLLDYVNGRLSKLHHFKEYKLVACPEPETGEILHKILTVRDQEGYRIENLGCGVQFVLMITLTILSHLLKLNSDAARESYIVEQDGKKYISLILGLDEPEIHLHPYMQRNLIKYTTSILNGADEDFPELIKDLFDIDGIAGQAIIITHSPNIILDDYTEIIRISKYCKATKVVSGTDINLTTQNRKHLIKNMPYVKEAFFSRGVIFVEGDSECGSFKILANKVAGDLDTFGISVIQAASAESIPPLVELFDKFNIPCTSIMDKDKESKYGPMSIPHLSFTNGQDFEEEIFDAFSIEDYIKYIEETTPDNKLFFMGEAKKLGITINPKVSPVHIQVSKIPDPQKKALKSALKSSILTYLRSNKTILTGIDLASYVTDVPDSYKSVILNSVELAKKCSL